MTLDEARRLSIYCDLDARIRTLSFHEHLLVPLLKDGL
jgi:hypothetical protein